MISPENPLFCLLSSFEWLFKTGLTVYVLTYSVAQLHVQTIKHCHVDCFEKKGFLCFSVPTGKSTIRSKIFVFNATITNNERGVVTKHYNNPSNEKMEIFHRAKYEEISFQQMTIQNSRKEAMFIPSLTKYHENFIPTLEEMTRPEKVGAIAYIIKNTKIKFNQKGIHAEHNHVDFCE